MPQYHPLLETRYMVRWRVANPSSTAVLQQSKPPVTVALIGHQLETNPQLLAAAVAGGIAGFVGAGVDAGVGTRVLLTALGACIPIAAHAAIVI
jgi:hypothetical protein